MKTRLLTPTTLGAVLAIAGYAGTALAQQPFGGEEDIQYADKLWQALKDVDLAGEGAIQSVPYEGQHPHGAVLVTLEDDLTLEGHTGPVLVKRNYGGEGVSTGAVANEPNQYLGAVTVMYQREEGYDPDNMNWFWAKYLPDGSLDRNPEDMPLAGRVAKGASQGCIACHQGAPGNDYVFNHDRYAP